MNCRIGIIGGGAAGLFAACQFKRLSYTGSVSVTLIDKNPLPGKKLILTGHGRCNITNLKDASVLRTGYHEAGNFIYPALKEFGPADTMRFFSDTLGLKLKEEENNRIFPVCDSAVRVREAKVPVSLATSFDYYAGFRCRGHRNSFFFGVQSAAARSKASVAYNESEVAEQYIDIYQG